MTKTERKKEMQQLRSMKFKLREIGALYGICRERVRQIIGNTGGLYELIKLRRPELIAVKKYFRLYDIQLAKLYSVPIGYIHKKELPYVNHYPPGFRRCYGDCHQVLPESNFYTPKCGRCKPCSRLQQIRNYHKYGTYNKYIRKT